MPKRIFFLLTIFAALVASAWDKPENWLEVRSPHFVVLSDSSEKEARHVADQFERMRSVFHTVLVHGIADPPTPIVVLAVKDKKDFQSLEPEAYLAKGQLELAGLFLRGPDKNYVLLRLDAQGEHPYAAIYHEYTHLLSSADAAWLPLWLNEGLAEFYQNTEIGDKDVLFGEGSRENILLLRQERLMPLPTLFAVDYNSPYYHQENKGSIFYAESWAVTHYFMNKDSQENTHHLTDYMELVSQKVDPVTAATRAFGDLKRLQAALNEYVSQASFRYFKMPISAEVDDATFKVQPVTPAQADAVRGDFLVYNQRIKDARPLLERVLREDPGNAPAHETMGYLEFREGNLDEARKWYGESIKLDSHSFLAYYYFAAITMSRGQLNSENKSQVENSLRAAIKLNPSFAPAYEKLAMFFGMQRENLEEADMLILNAVELDPGNLRYRLNTANILLQMQRGNDAIRVLQNAMGLAKTPEEVNSVQNLLQAAQQGQSSPQTEPSSTGQKQESLASDSSKLGPRQPDTGKVDGDYGLGTGRKPTAAMGPLEVLTDTMGVDFGPYLQRVLHDVRMNWYNLIPESARAPLMKKGKLTIEFAITKDGQVAGMKLVKTSGDLKLDRGAWGGITGSNPFPPLPSEFGGQFLGLRFTFFYNPDRADLDGSATPKSPLVAPPVDRGSAAATETVVRLSEILISTPPPYDPAQVAAARQKAEQLRAAIGIGGTFADIARANSQGPTAAQGGDMGCFTHGKLAQPLEQLVFGMKVDDVSDVVQTKQGFVILEVTDRGANCADLEPSKRPSSEKYGPIDILTDTQGVNLHAYLQPVLNSVRNNWYRLIPESARAPTMKKGKVAIAFRVMKDGKITDVHLAESSGDVTLDRAAYGGVTESSPLPPLPSAFSCNFLTLRFRFYYNPGNGEDFPRESSGTRVPCVTTAIQVGGEIGVTVSPASTQVMAGAGQQFMAAVTGNVDPTVSWSVGGSGCTAADCGIISGDGLYTAPLGIPNPATITVTATLAATPSQTASATVTIVSPSSPPH